MSLPQFLVGCAFVVLMNIAAALIDWPRHKR